MPDLMHEKRTIDFDAIRLSIADPEHIMDWSHGEVTKPETINYRTQKPEKDGLFDERIFGPSNDFECYCGKYKGIHYRGVECDRCGVLVSRSIVRRERMGHIDLAAPVTHIWFLRGIPSSIGLILGMTTKDLEQVVYFASYIVTEVDEDAKQSEIADLEDELEEKQEAIEEKFEAQAEAEEIDIEELAEDKAEELNEVKDEYQEQIKQLESLAPKSLLNESEYSYLSRNYSQLFKAGMGATAIKTLLENVDLQELIDELNQAAEETNSKNKKRKLLKRLKKLEGILKAGIEPEWMIMDNVPVIPPDLRPMVQLTGGRFATSDLNDLYRRVINRNNRLKKLLDLQAPKVICRNEMRMLQESVDALIDNNRARGRAVSSRGGRRQLKSLTDMLRGKQGRFRQNLLGKRVDYSGRSVIVAGPDLNIDQCGLPKMMALELFRPFVINQLIEDETAHNVKAAGRMIEDVHEDVWDALDTVIQDRYVLLNRAPTLHRLGVQAFKPVLIEGKAIQLHPLVCGGFNADFDGDQMAVHVPLSDEAQAEAEKYMAADHNLLKPSDGKIIINISQDMVLGIYYLTYQRYPEQEPEKYYSNFDEVIHAYHRYQIDVQTPIYVKIAGELIETTAGRVLFNDALPDDFVYRNETFTDKKLQTLMDEIFNRYGEDQTASIANNLKTLGFQAATESGLSTGMDDFVIPEQKPQMLAEAEERVAEISNQYNEGLITEQERSRLTIDVWREVNDDMQGLIRDNFEESDNSTTITVVSGARAKLSAISQISGMKGMIQDVHGNTIELPIRSNYKEGLTPMEYFSDARGSRKGLIDTALRTADSGYLTRRMVDVSQDVFTVEDDCGDQEGLVISKSESEAIGEDFAERLFGRYTLEPIKDGRKTIVKADELISKDQSEQIVEAGIESARIRSVLKCQTLKGVCCKCYGLDLARGNMVDIRVPVGVIAAQAVGEPGTQLTLRTFHKGGVAGSDITHGLPRIEELLEARDPKGEAIISEIEGQVKIDEGEDNYYIRVQAEDVQPSAHQLDEEYTPTISTGDDVKEGQVIAKTEDGDELESEAEGVAYITEDRIDVVDEEAQVVEYKSPSYRGLSVEDGDQVQPGDHLTPGSKNLDDLLELTDRETVQRYIMSEIQSIFNLQGQTIADKHLEIIVRQLFSKVRVTDSGDSSFITGDLVSKAAVIHENRQLEEQDKQLATYKSKLMGMIKVSTWSDSFLSAASFQDTTRVLINAATAGSVDELYGLKENVIIGRKIPVGTGWRGIEVEDEVDEA